MSNKPSRIAYLAPSLTCKNKVAAWDPDTGLMLGQSDTEPRLIQKLREGLISKAREKNFRNASRSIVPAVMPRPVDRIVQAQFKTQLKAQLRQIGVSPPTIISAPVAQSHPIQDAKRKFTVGEKFRFLATCIDLIIQRKTNFKALLITGNPGTGKSFTISERMAAAGFTNSHEYLAQLEAAKEAAKAAADSEDDDVEAEDVADVEDFGDYVIFKGSMTPKMMFTNLFKYSDRMIVWDDSDNVLKDKKSVMTFKGALELRGKRYITWGADKFSRPDGIPQTFEFKGHVIFVSNMQQDDVDEAIRSRALCVDVTLNYDEMLERILWVISNTEAYEDFTSTMKREVWEFLYDRKEVASQLNFRTYEKTLEFRKNIQGAGEWQAMTEFSVIG